MKDEIDIVLGKLDAYPGSLLFARLADAYLQADKMNEAIAVCEQGLAHHTEYANGHLIMARCYARLGLRDQAKIEFEQTLELDSEHMAAFLNLGDIYYEEKQIDRALHCYQRALEPDPLSEIVQQRISSLKHRGSLQAPEHEDHGKADDENRDLRETITTVTLAEIYASQGLIEKAVDMYRRVLTYSPDQRDVSDRIQELEERLRKEEEGGANGNDS